jgi:hypothetical protein
MITKVNILLALIVFAFIYGLLILYEMKLKSKIRDKLKTKMIMMQFLEDTYPNLRKKYLHNLLRQNYIHCRRNISFNSLIIHLSRINDFSTFISQSFNCIKTKEGCDYWMKIAQCYS